MISYFHGRIPPSPPLPGQVQPGERKGDGRAELLLEPVALRESLEVNHEYLGQPVEGVALRAPPARLAPLARRHLVAVHDLLLGEGVEAVGEGDVAGAGGDAEAEVPEGLEGDGLVGALRALERRLELSDEEVNQLGVVTADVALPRLHRLLAHAEEEGKEEDEVKDGDSIKDKDKGDEKANEDKYKDM